MDGNQTMKSRRRSVRARALRATALVLAVGAVLNGIAYGAAVEAAGPEPTVVLDSLSFWRCYHTARPPVAEVDGLIVPLDDPWPEWEKYSPPADWTTPDFDDRGWARSLIHVTPFDIKLERLCLRGKFTVTDPSMVDGLKASVAFYGGAIMYVNGREIARAHIAPGADLAEPYPPEAFLKDGTLAPRIGPGSVRRNDPRDSVGQARRRVLEDVDIPPDALRTGVNVLAVEIVRGPYSRDVRDYQLKNGNDTRFRWPLCVALDACLTAERADGLVPNARRPEGLQVWNQDLLASDFITDRADQAEPLRPVRIVGARNGAFSGKLMLGSTRPIRGLDVSASDLEGPQGVVPASAVQVRYALPWGSNYTHTSRNSRSIADPELGCLVETPPAEIAPAPSVLSRNLAEAAVTTLWLTVRVPEDAAAGTYAGTVRIAAQGEAPLTAPVELEVADWTLSAPQDYHVWAEILQSPDTLALEYDTPLWSERHWEMIARSFRLVRDSGTRVAYVPLIAESNFGNAESMVRWVRKPDGTYGYDLSIMDRYLTTAEENLGPLKIVIVPVWEAYMARQEDFQGRGYHKEFMEKNNRFEGNTGPKVTVVDEVAGTIETVVLPGLQDPGSRELWQPLMEQVRSHLAQRGLEDRMMLGMMNDACPSKQDIAFFAEVAPGVPWVVAAHGTYTKADFGYRAIVYSKTGHEESLAGWSRPELIAYFHRGNNLERIDQATWRTLPTFAIAGSWRGVGRVGGDFWKVIRNKKGERAARVPERYPQSNWRNLDVYIALLAPTPEGPAVTTRYEHLREGIQEGEARVVVERAVKDAELRAKLGEDLAARCEEALEEHFRAQQRLRGWTGQAVPHCLSAGTEMGFAWFMSSGWQARTRALFTLAGEVERATGSTPP